MLSSYSFKVNTVKNNKILFVNASVLFVDSWGSWVPGAQISSQTELLLIAQWFGRKGSWNRGWGPIGLAPEILAGNSIWISSLLPNWGLRGLGGSGRLWLLWPLYADHFPEGSTEALAEPNKDWPHIHFLSGAAQLLFLSYLFTNIPSVFDHWCHWLMSSSINDVGHQR